MKKAVLWSLVLSMVLLLSAAGCGGGGGGGNDDDKDQLPTTGVITGKVVDNSTGAAIDGATVTDGAASTETGTDGAYTLTVAPADRKVLTISSTGFSFTSKVTRVTAGGTSRVNAALLPVAYSAAIDPTVAQSLSVPGSSASVALPANSLVTGLGSAPSGTVTANITPLDPSSNPQLMPGDFSESAGGLLESYGAMEVNFQDSTGANLNLASGQTSTIRIPVAVGATSPAATMGMYSYNATSGQWVLEGTLTLGGTAPNQYYEGAVGHFSYWNADQVYDTTCINGTVVDASGLPVAGAVVETQGRDYIGTSTAYSGAGGIFTVQAKANSEVIVSARTSNALSNSLVVNTGAAGTSCTSLSENLILGTIGGVGSGSATIRLTWGTDPWDLDSHLTGPDPDSPDLRFHVYFVNRGTLGVAPYANLDVDDVTSFGPEVVTISRFTPGVYRYSVHHYSGPGTIISSPARVELTLNGETTVFTPPADTGGVVIGENSVWQVFELNVDSLGTVTVNPLNAYLTDVSAYYVTKPLINGVKPPVTGGNW